jgi:hypothetical protein
MKRAANLLSVAAAAGIISFLELATLAQNAHGQGQVRWGGGYGTAFTLGVHGGSSFKFFGGFNSGFSGGSYGGNRQNYGGWGGSYPFISYGGHDRWAPAYEYTSYYYAPQVIPVSYSPPPVVYVSPPPVIVRPALPAVIYGTQIASSSPDVQSPPPSQYSPKNQSLGVADVKALAKAGVSEGLMVSQIRNSGVTYHLTAAEIIDLKESGVSEKVIAAMIGTPPAGSTATDARFKLTGIMGAPEIGYSAVINGQRVVENSYVDGATVKKIERNQAALDLDGHEFVVRL